MPSGQLKVFILLKKALHSGQGHGGSGVRQECDPSDAHTFLEGGRKPETPEVCVCAFHSVCSFCFRKCVEISDPLPAPCTPEGLLHTLSSALSRNKALQPKWLR